MSSDFLKIPCLILSGLFFKKANKQLGKFEAFIATCELLKLSISSIRISAQVYGELRENGITIDTADLLIAGVAIENDLTLVTNNQRHYQPN